MVPPLPAAEAIASLLQRFSGETIAPGCLHPITSGASGRCVLRPVSPAANGLLGIYWTADRADNHSFVPAAMGLARHGLAVPAILASVDLGEGCGACLTQDLGKTDLLSLKGACWQRRKDAYALAMQAIIPFHRLKPDWSLQPPFDASLYRWEQEYFATHFLGRHCGVDPRSFLSLAPMRDLADWLSRLPRVPIHRDFQSQNIMLHEGKAWLIDFQGMRYGRQEYDLASLLCDPYMELTSAEQEELLSLYERLSGMTVDLSIYTACACQRLMQALGAFANIGYNQRRDWYLRLIPVGWKNLQSIARLAPLGSPAAHAVSCLPNVA